MKQKRADSNSIRGDLTRKTRSRKARGQEQCSPLLVQGGREFPEDGIKEVAEILIRGRFVLTPRRLLLVLIIAASIALGIWGKAGFAETFSAIAKALLQARGG